MHHKPLYNVQFWFFPGFSLVFLGFFSAGVALTWFYGWSQPRGLNTGIFGMAAIMAGGSFAKQQLRAFNTAEYVRVLFWMRTGRPDGTGRHGLHRAFSGGY